MNLSELKQKPIGELLGIAQELGLENLARTGHFSRAAELSHISQPAFSRRIKAIEDWVGVALVDRSRHPVTLTSAGSQMLEAGRQALERLAAHLCA